MTKKRKSGPPVPQRTENERKAELDQFVELNPELIGIPETAAGASGLTVRCEACRFACKNAVRVFDG
jgi:hypothetical protein